MSVPRGDAADDTVAASNGRAVIDQAIGVLMTLSGSTAEQAFTELARQSQNTNVKLRDIATRVVAGQQRGHP